MIEIALIDNGINNKLYFENLKSFIVEERKCKEIFQKENVTDRNSFSHGMKCGLIFHKFCPKGRINSIQILNDKGIGFLDKLKPALEWCCQNHVQLVNLSLGTTHFKDKAAIRTIINHYANKGMVIVAATANSGYRAFPSSFTNVIGVQSGDKLAFDYDMLLQKGIDLVAPSQHKITMDGEPIQLNKSNSYAAPYITAMIGNFMESEPCKTVTDVRKKLFLNVSQTVDYVCYPDWIENAWVSHKCKKSEAGYYFNEIREEFKICQSVVDTVVLKSYEEYIKYSNKEKHIVYLGDKRIKHSVEGKHFWSKEQRITQIINSNKRNTSIHIPLICCKFDENQDELLWLNKLKCYFGETGYNVYAVSNIIESVLYDLEYLPDEVCKEFNREKIHDFIYWQTYYNQSDVILAAVKKDTDILSFVNSADMLIEIISKKVTWIKVYCDGKERIKEKIGRIDSSAIKGIYKKILMLLTEETDEQ